jgi:preprotein translocase subunit SecE
VNKISIFLKEVLVEMKRVSWLSQKDILKYTGIVLVATIAVAAFLGALDLLFTTIIKTFILK